MRIPLSNRPGISQLSPDRRAAFRTWAGSRRSPARGGAFPRTPSPLNPHLPSHRKPEALKSKAERKFLRKPALCIKWASSLRSPLRSICGSPLFCHFLSYHWIYIKNMLHGIFCFCKGFIQSLTFLAGPQIFPFVFFYFLVAFICPGILLYPLLRSLQGSFGKSRKIPF